MCKSLFQSRIPFNTAGTPLRNLPGLVDILLGISLEVLPLPEYLANKILLHNNWIYCKKKIKSIKPYNTLLS